jgi:hypothetical protein
VIAVRADMEVGDEAVAFTEIGLDALPEVVELLGIERAVDAAPVDWSSQLGSRTMKRSPGERPVRLPVVTSRAPVSVRPPSPRRKDSSISSAGSRSTYSRGEWLLALMLMQRGPVSRIFLSLSIPIKMPNTRRPGWPLAAAKGENSGSRLSRIGGPM